MEEAIRVCIRQRPLFPKEVEAGHTRAWKLYPDGAVTLEITPQGIPVKKSYAFDLCFDEDCSNDLVYEKTARDIVRDIAKGINGCYMAYGQTGCGKTHSIMGTAQDPGILPRSVAELFDIVDEGSGAVEDEGGQTEYLMRVTYVEIYLERVNDLFQDGPKGESQPLENLDVKEDPKGGFFVVGLAEREVSTVDDVMKLLQSAEMKRHFARTNFNETSSRSHTVFTTIMESTLTYPDGSTIVRRGELKLVDLAGNERASAAEGVEGAKERQAEGQAINKSLFLLSEVIAKLSKRAEYMKKGAADKAEKLKRDMMHIPWRDSKLTRLLQKALGGNSRACLLVAVHPSTQALEISLSTLRFALKAKQIKKKIVQNFVSPEHSLIMQQKETIKILQAQLAALQEMTGVMITEEMRSQIAKTLPEGRPIVTGTAASNEAIDRLKKQLQEKVGSLSRIILKARLEPGRREEVPFAPLARAITISGVRGRFERLATLPEGLKRQLYRRVPPHVGEPEAAKLGSIAATLDYLRAINEMNKEHSAVEQQQEAEAVTDLSRYDTVRLDRLVADDEAQRADAQATRRKLTSLRIGNTRLMRKNRVFLAQIDYLKGLLNKLGLSLLLTAIEVSDEEAQPHLAPSLAMLAIPEELPPERHEKRLDVYLKSVQPLAYAMASRVVCRAVHRHLTGEEAEEDVKDALSDMKRLQRVDSVFALLRPWEQYVLAILFEQKEMHEDIQKAVDGFQETIRDLRKRVHNLTAEKIELVEHCTRLVDELRSYRYEAIPRGEPAAAETFARLLSRINALQTELGDKTTELKLLRADYNDTYSAKLVLDVEVAQLKERLYSFDTELLPADLTVETMDEGKRKLLQEAMFTRHLATQLRLQLNEARMFEADLRQVNTELWKELKTTRLKCDRAVSDQKLAEFELRNERLALQKRVEALYNAQLDSQTECEHLRIQLEKLKAEREPERRPEAPSPEAGGLAPVPEGAAVGPPSPPPPPLVAAKPRLLARPTGMPRLPLPARKPAITRPAGLPKPPVLIRPTQTLKPSTTQEMQPVEALPPEEKLPTPEVSSGAETLPSPPPVAAAPPQPKRTVPVVRPVAIVKPRLPARSVALPKRRPLLR